MRRSTVTIAETAIHRVLIG